MLEFGWQAYNKQRLEEKQRLAKIELERVQKLEEQIKNKYRDKKNTLVLRLYHMMDHIEKLSNTVIYLKEKCYSYENYKLFIYKSILLFILCHHIHYTYNFANHRKIL
jgi:hypothetical protein